MKDRVIYIDRLKGYAILLVVVGHIIQLHTKDSTTNPLFEIIYSFHMPFFFFLCGYIADKTTSIKFKTDYWLFIKKKSMSLLIPFFIWPLIINNYFLNNSYYSNFTDIVIKQLGPTPSLWFLITLYKIMIIFSIFYIISNKWKKSIYKDLILLIIIFIPLFLISLNNFIYFNFLLYTSFFFFGIFLSKHIVLDRIINNKWVFLVTTILFFLLVGYYHSSAPETLFLKAIKLILTFALSFFATVSLYNFSKRLDHPSWMDNFWIPMGQATIIIYITPIILLPKTFFFPTDFPTLLILILCLIFSVLQMYISLAIGKIIECLPVLNLLLYGKLIKAKHNSI